jgi:branched-chain amino acid transport system substrate-binding protein
MKEFLSKWGLVIAIIAFAISVGAGVYLLVSSKGGGKLADGVVKIGLMVPLSGDASSYGFSIVKGIELAKKETGLSNIEIISEDTKCDKDVALKAYPKLIEKGVVALIPDVENAKIVLISPSATSPDLTGKSKYFFRTAPSDAFQGVFGAQLIREGGYKNLAIVYSNEEYGKAFEQVVEKEFKKQGGKIAAIIPFEKSSFDLSKEVDATIKAKPDAVLVISNSPTSGASIVKNLKVKGFTGQIFGSEGLWGNVVLREAGKYAEGLIVTVTPTGTSLFKEAHRIEFGIEPGPYAAQAYDAFKALWKAIDSGSKNSEDIAKNLRTVKFEGASGSISFDAKGDVKGSYNVMKVVDQKFVLVNE